MKKLIILLAVVLIGCSNNDDSNMDLNSILGKWELYSYTEDGYDEFEGFEGQFPTVEFIAPNTYRQLSFERDGSVSADYVGTFTLEGDILTINETSLNGNAINFDPLVFVDVVISGTRMTWGERYDDGYESGYATLHFRKL